MTGCRRACSAIRKSPCLRHTAERLPNTLQLAVAGLDGETLLMQLDKAGIAVSSGSACSSGKTEPSHVLMAMGVDAELARGAIRISLGRETTGSRYRYPAGGIRPADEMVRQGQPGCWVVMVKRRNDIKQVHGTMTVNTPIYLDYSATTPVDPRVAEKMCTYLTPQGEFGNPASRSHVFGWHADEAVEEARANVAALVNADPREIIWTSGATESDNLAIKGAAHFYQKQGKHIVTLKTEHKAVLDSCRQLEREGFEVTYLDPEAYRSAGSG